MKFMLTINDVPYEKWIIVLKDDLIIETLIKTIKDEKVDAIAFDFMYQVLIYSNFITKYITKECDL